MMLLSLLMPPLPLLMLLLPLCRKQCPESLCLFMPIYMEVYACVCTDIYARSVGKYMSIFVWKFNPVSHTKPMGRLLGAIIWLFVRNGESYLAPFYVTNNFTSGFINPRVCKYRRNNKWARTTKYGRGNCR